MVVVRSLIIPMLTYMATIDQALASGVLERYSKPDWEMRPALRFICVAPELFEWVDNTPGLFAKENYQGGRNLVDHLEQFFCSMMCDVRPGGGELRRVIPVNMGIVKWHPPGLRVFGWYHQPGEFVAVTAALAKDTHGPRGSARVAQLRDAVWAFAERHGLTATILRGEIHEIICKKA